MEGRGLAYLQPQDRLRRVQVDVGLLDQKGVDLKNLDFALTRDFAGTCVGDLTPHGGEHVAVLENGVGRNSNQRDR